ncbi:MAG: clostripain-related cysteine peptidase [Oscillospiraceae bacterium]
MVSIPKWVILAYLNGNSELEPETAAAKSEIEKAAFGEDVEVLLQIGLLDETTVKILRPDAMSCDMDDKWSGVRRYHICRSGSFLVGDMGNKNMADPNCLFDFIKWGMENYKAEHYILILGGHSCEYIGMMNDYSQDKPYIMGIPEISLVLELVKHTAGRAIDLLIFDTCLFNNIELLYELGQYGIPAVKTVLTYRGNAPAGGLFYSELLNAVNENCDESDLDIFIEKLVGASQADLIAYRINPAGLENIKRQFSCLADAYLSDASSSRPDLPELLKSAAADNPWRKIVDEIAYTVSSLVICRKCASCRGTETIRVLDRYIPFMSTAALYYRLAFARDNCWTKVLCSRLPESSFRLAVTIGFTPMILPKSKIKALMISGSPVLSPSAAEGILNGLIAYKKWVVL